MAGTLYSKGCKNFPLALAVLTVASVVGAGAAPIYNVFDLGTITPTFTPYNTYSADGINNNNQVVVTAASITRTGVQFSAPLLWDPLVGQTGIGVPGPNAGVATGINDRGQVLLTQNSQAVVWDRVSGFSQVAGGSCPAGSEGRAINNSGTVGGSCTSALGTRAFLNSPATGFRDLGTFEGGRGSVVYGLNENGTAVGAAFTDSFLQRPVLFTAGGLLDLGTLGGRGGVAYAISNRNQVVGAASLASSTSPDPSHAFLWTQDAGMTDLGTLGGIYSSALAINESGDIVGNSYTLSAGYHAFLYANGTMVDLNDLISPDAGWVLTSATGINDAGYIIGSGRHNGLTGAYLLSPVALVPEPSSVVMTAGACIALWLRLRHKRCSQNPSPLSF